MIKGTWDTGHGIKAGFYFPMPPVPFTFHQKLTNAIRIISIYNISLSTKFDLMKKMIVILAVADNFTRHLQVVKKTTMANVCGQ